MLVQSVVRYYSSQQFPTDRLKGLEGWFSFQKPTGEMAKVESAKDPGKGKRGL